MLSVEYADHRSMISLAGGVVHVGEPSSRLQIRAPVNIGDTNGSAFGGDVAEIMVFNRVLSVGERETVSQYFFNKYGFTNSVPVAPTNLLAKALSSSQNWRSHFIGVT